MTSRAGECTGPTSLVVYVEHSYTTQFTDKPVTIVVVPFADRYDEIAEICFLANKEIPIVLTELYDALARFGGVGRMLSNGRDMPSPLEWRAVLGDTLPIFPCSNLDANQYSCQTFERNRKGEIVCACAGLGLTMEELVEVLKFISQHYLFNWNMFPVARKDIDIFPETQPVEGTHKLKIMTMPSMAWAKNNLERLSRGEGVKREDYSHPSWNPDGEDEENMAPQSESSNMASDANRQNRNPPVDLTKEDDDYEVNLLDEMDYSADEEYGDDMDEDNSGVENHENMPLMTNNHLATPNADAASGNHTAGNDVHEPPSVPAHQEEGQNQGAYTPIDKVYNTIPGGFPRTASPSANASTPHIPPVASVGRAPSVASVGNVNPGYLVKVTGKSSAGPDFEYTVEVPPKSNDKPPQIFINCNFYYGVNHDNGSQKIENQKKPGPE